MVTTVITEAVSSMVGWLENGLDFHVSKDEEGVEGKSVVLVSTASPKASLTSSTKALGMRVVSHARILRIDAYGAGAARQRRTQNARLTKIKKRMPNVQFYKKDGAITSKIAKAGLMPSGLHGVRRVGMPPSRLKAFRTTIGRCLPGKHAGRSLTWRLRFAPVRPDTPLQSRAHRCVGRGSVGLAAGRRGLAQGMETAARGPKWCTAARKPHADVRRRNWECFQDIGDQAHIDNQAHIDSVTKCKAHLSKSEQAKSLVSSGCYGMPWRTRQRRCKAPQGAPSSPVASPRAVDGAHGLVRSSPPRRASGGDR